MPLCLPSPHPPTLAPAAPASNGSPVPPPAGPSAAAAAATPPRTLYRAPSTNNLGRSSSNTSLGRVPSSSNLDVVSIKGTASHPWHDLPVGENAPEAVNAVIEIPQVRCVRSWLCAG